MAPRPQSAEHGPIPTARHRAGIPPLGRGPGRGLLVLGDTHPVETAPPPMPSYRPLTPAARLRLEAALLARWGPKHADQCLRQLRPWSGWRWPLEAELREAIPWVSRPIRARRLRAAREELPAMRQLQPLTPADEISLVRQRVA